MHDKIVDLYERNAAAWAEMRGTWLQEKAWLDTFTVTIPVGGAILDLGCGNGEPIARELIARGFALTGVDSSPSLIAMAAERFPDAEWQVADMRTLDLDRRFDGLIAWHSFFHLHPEDQRPMFARFATHLKAGGVLMFTSGPGHGEAIGEWQSEPLYHGSLAPEEYRGLLDAAGFETLHHKVSDPDCGGATVWIARRASPHRRR